MFSILIPRNKTVFEKSDQARPRRPLKKMEKNEVTEKKRIASLGGIRTLNACISSPNRFTNWATEDVVISESSFIIFIFWVSFFEAALGLTWSLLAKIVLVISNQQRISYPEIIVSSFLSDPQIPLVSQTLHFASSTLLYLISFPFRYFLRARI